MYIFITKLPNKSWKGTKPNFLRSSKEWMDVQLLQKYWGSWWNERLSTIETIFRWNSMYHLSRRTSLFQFGVQNVSKMCLRYEIRQRSPWMLDYTRKYCHPSAYFGKNGSWYFCLRNQSSDHTLLIWIYIFIFEMKSDDII